ncbi:hypothetical protein CAEBREN_01067 [Caenorhabditis brenneri]|uniref:Uncharacterized protein n=1 Tax=Caenorhabditis brenneri TaxID=135651 RepID=G0MIS7_CAEBE|nr:hypothetical protein CAEBREN_01067 [Caenorhabditis brenneri]
MDYHLAPTPTEDTMYTALGPTNSLEEFLKFIARVESFPGIRVTPRDQQLYDDFQQLLAQQTELNRIMEDWGLWEEDLIQYSKEAERAALLSGIQRLLENRRVQEEKWFWEKLMEEVAAEMAAEEERERQLAKEDCSCDSAN